MPTREETFQNNCYYHVFDKTIDKIPIFLTDKVACKFINIFLYYRSNKSTIRYSKLKELDEETRKNKLKESLCKKNFQTDIISYCLMPNHYHFILKQLQDNGIKTFMTNISNSITRYFNILNKRKGPIFLTQFRAKKSTIKNS